MLNAECFLILQAKENRGQTSAGVYVYVMSKCTHLRCGGIQSRTSAVLMWIAFRLLSNRAYHWIHSVSQRYQNPKGEKMDVQAFSEWLSGYSVSDRIRLLALVYSRLTIGARQLFLPEASGKEKRVLEILHGLNEVHHTIANSLCDYTKTDSKPFPVGALGQQLLEIEENITSSNSLRRPLNTSRITVPVPQWSDDIPRSSVALIPLGQPSWD